MEIIILIFSVLILILLIYLLLRPQQDQNNALNEIRLELLKDQHESFQRLQNQTRADIHDAMQPVNEKMVMLQKEFNMTKAELQQDTQAGFSLMRSQLLDVLQKQMDLLETNNRQNEKVLKELQNVLIKDIFEQNQKASAALMAQIKDGLGIIQDQNTKKLQEMQSGINEKLSESLDKRLDDSFRQIGERLSSLYTSLGELRNLESGVQSLNRTLSNVKTRGIWGEMQLGNILADIFTPGQYEENVATRKNSSERVEYAVRIPDKEDPEHFFYLPIDSKFPADLFARIQDAAKRADSDALKPLQMSSGSASRAKRCPSATNTSLRRTRPTLPSCSCRQKAFTPKCCEWMDLRRNARKNIRSSYRDQLRWPRSSTACASASAI